MYGPLDMVTLTGEKVRTQGASGGPHIRLAEAWGMRRLGRGQL